MPGSPCPGGVRVTCQQPSAPARAVASSLALPAAETKLQSADPWHLQPCKQDRALPGLEGARSGPASPASRVQAGLLSTEPDGGGRSSKEVASRARPGLCCSPRCSHGPREYPCCMQDQRPRRAGAVEDHTWVPTG